MACGVTAVNLLRRGCQKLAIILIILPSLVCVSLPANALAQSTPRRVHMPTPPVIDNVQWDPVVVGANQCVNGSGFGVSSSGTAVSLNDGTGLTPSLWSDSQVCAVIPSDTPDGTATLQIITESGFSNIIGFTVTTLIPSVTGITPARAGAGAQVTISGVNLGAAQNDSTIQLRGQAFFEVVSWTDTQIVATIPAGIPPGGIYLLDVTVHGLTTSVGLTILGLPQVASVQWDPLAVGGTQCVNGTGFDNATGTVSLNDSVLTPSLWSSTLVCFVAPNTTTPGMATVQVINADGASNPLNFVVTTAVPVITGISPTSAGPGMPVSIAGANFGAAQGAGFVQLQGQNLEIVTWSDTQIVALTPAGIPPGGLYSISLTVNGVTVTAGVTIVSPPQIFSVQWDPVALGGNQCANGIGFGSTAGRVILNDLGLTPSLWNDTVACAAVPNSTTPGLATLLVANAIGSSNSFGFAVTTNVPVLTGVSPSSAGAGTAITFTGSNFGDAQGASFVQMLGQNFGILSWSNTQITATVPAGISPGVYSVDVTVAGLTVSNIVSIVGAPQVTSVQWNPIALGGTQCVTGTGFGNAAGSVLLNGATLDPILWSDSRACFVVPVDTLTGPATLQLVNGAGPGNAISFIVTALTPVVTGVSPAITGAGLPVTITGANFGAAQGSSTVQLRGQFFGIISW